MIGPLDAARAIHSSRADVVVDVVVDVVRRWPGEVHLGIVWSSPMVRRFPRGCIAVRNRGEASVRRRYRLTVLLVLCTALWASTLFGAFESGSAHALTVGGSTVSARLVRSIVGAAGPVKPSSATPCPTSRRRGRCVDVVSTTAGPRRDPSSAPDPNLRYFAIALDAVTWATKSPDAPATMTLDQLQDVFACRITNWAQLPGGHDGAIRRVMPPASSGTAIAFVRLLGGSSPSTVSRPADPNAYGPLDRGCPAVSTMQENAGTDRVLRSPTVAAQAILPYSAGTWAWQTSHASRRHRDRRLGIRLGAISTGGVAVRPVRQDGSGVGLDPAVVREPGTAPPGAPVFPGAYYLYTVVSARSPSYGAIVAAVGFQPAEPEGDGSSGLCKGEHRADILDAGFLPLDPLPSTSSTCRLEVPVQPGLSDTPPTAVTAPSTTTVPAPAPTTAGPPVTTAVPPSATSAPSAPAPTSTTVAPTTTTAAPTTTRPAVTTTVPAPTAPTPPVAPPVTPPGTLTAPRLFADDSLWNTPKAPTVFAPAADATIQSLPYGLNNGAFSHPFYRAKATDPVTTFRLGAGWGHPATTMVTPAPAGMHPASGSDGVMTVLLTDGTLLDMYGVSGGGTDWTATFYGTSDGVHGPGFGEQGTWTAIGTTAIGSPQAAGTILASDVAAGVIPHAIFIAYDYANEGGTGTSGTPGVAPAVSNDDGGGPGPLPQGGLLVATGDMPSGLNAMERALWTAARTYGVYVCDRLGGGPMFSGDGSAVVGAAFTDAGLTKIGHSLRLVKTWG